MSVLVTSKVWNGYPNGGSEELVFLYLADRADDAGKCWPSISTISKKVHLSRSQTQRVVHKLIDDGYVLVIGNENGGVRGTSRQYQINLTLLTGRIDATGSASATGSMDALEGSHGYAKTGSASATQSIIDTSKIRHRRRTRFTPVTNPEDSQEWKEWGNLALEIRKDWNCADVLAEYAVFCDYWTDPNKQPKDVTKLDWLATWRIWCRKSYRKGAYSPR